MIQLSATVTDFLCPNQHLILSGYLARSVLDELTLYLIVDESRLLLEEDDSLDVDWDEWIYDFFEDMDVDGKPIFHGSKELKPEKAD